MTQDWCKFDIACEVYRPEGYSGCRGCKHWGSDVCLSVDDPAGTAAPPSGELFDKYFAVESTETSKWTCTVKSPLTGVPDYPDVNSTIKANTIFTGFSDFDSCTFEVTIAVTDVNSQTPEFNQVSYSVDISEDTQVDALVATDITIRDQDKDEPNNVVVLSVDDNCPVSPDPSEYKDFGGNFKDANFKLRTRVDYEETKSYDCILTLKDKGISELFTTADLKVMVKDIPDQDPVFDENFYTAEVTDPVPEEGGTILETQPKPIHAVDGDTGDPSLITYSMEVLDPAGLGTTYFVIDSTTGVLTHVAPLEDEVLEKKRFIIRLTATDESKAKGNSILEIDLPPVPTTTPEPTTSTTVVTTTTPEPTTTSTTVLTETTTTPPSSTHESSSSSSETPSTTASSVTESTTTPSVTESTSSSSMTQSTTTSVMTESTTSPTTTPGPEMSLHFTKDAYAGDVPERYAAAFLKVDVIVKGFDRSDVIFSLEDSDSAYFDINSPDGEIRLKTGAEAPPPGEYSFTARAKGPEETKLESTAKVNVVVLTASPENLSLTQSLYWTKLMENKTQERFFEIKVDDTAVDPVSYCIINVKPTKYNESFQVVEDAGKWYLEMKGEPIDYEKTQEVSLIIQVFDKEGPCEDKTVQSLSRNEAMVLISIINLNDEDPFFQIPSSGAETVFYPKDVALQKIVGPVTTLQADDGDLKDSSLGEKISYSITNEVAGFSIEKDTGAIYVKSEFSCEGEGCQIKVKALDAVNHATEEVTIVVKSLDMGSIFTLALNDTEVGQVDGKLRTLSDEVGLQISKVYVNSEVEVSTEVQQRYPGFSPHRSRHQFGQPTEYLSSGSSSNAEEHWQIEVNVYAMDEAGNLVTLEEFNKKLSESDHNEAVPFVDEEIFNPPAAGDDTGLIAAVSVLAVLLGIILLAGGGFLVYRKHRARTTNKPKDISTVGGAYPNHSYSDDESETKSATSKRSDVMVLNGSLGRTDDVDTFGELNNEGKIGLRRTDPGTPEFYGISSREPPPSYNKEERPTSKPLVGSLSKDTGSSLYPSLTSDGPVEPQTTTTYLTKNPKKAPPPLNSAPAKSILRGKSGSDTRQDIPLYNTSFQQKDTSKPPEPAADYKEDENDDAPVTSAFASLKGSPKLKKKSVPEGDHLKPEDDDSDEDGDSHSGKVSFKREVREIGGPEEKKSNLKQDNEREDEEEKSVAFKVLVDMKVVETENAGPSQKAAAVAAAKSDALEILEANRKKMKESAGAGEEKEEDGDDDMLQSSL
ncbi:cadherin-87A-like [Macrobrachium nipponense]|uniref:cadherin-87A-like n=1 Tax=Macrobrachium nipponense TaxID=159736 RepID=UPI0030C83B83